MKIKKQTQLLLLCLSSSGFLTEAAFAQEAPVEEAASTTPPQDEIAQEQTENKEATPIVVPDPDTTPEVSVTEEGDPLIPEEFISDPVVNRIELGLGYVSDDAYKFGRYNGLQSNGPYVLGDVNIRDYFEDGRFWTLRGTNLGLESRYLRLEGGKQGSYQLFFEYDELPNYKNNTVQSPFLGIGSDNLTLPPGFTSIDPITNNNIDAYLNSFELKTKRERIGAGARFIPRDRWQFDVDFSNESKEGIDATGAAIANGSTQVIGNTTTSLAPEVIDYETNKVNAKIQYAGDDGQVDLTYHMSIFENSYDALTWQDPFNTAAIGSMSLAPDNEFHQLSLNGGYTLPYSSRITGLFSMGRMTQNDNFMPYTVNNGLTTTPLPASSLDGEVWLTTAQLKLTSRPIRKLRLNAELRYHERDNRTPVNTYNYVILDSHSTANTVVDNNPYSYENNRFKLDANYRFNAITSLRGGYKYSEMKRSYVNAEREDTEEDTLYAKWKLKAHSTLDLTFKAETSQRDGSDYVPQSNENPAMKKYFLADRDRNTYGLMIDYMATEKLFLSARADYNKDEYSDSTLGLTEAEQPVYTVDFSYTPAHNITTYGYYTYEEIQSSQNGEVVAGSGWTAEFNDTFDTAGLGAKLTDLGKWEIGADLVYSKSSGAIQMTNLAALGTETQYPDTRTELSSVKLWTTYNYSKRVSYKFGYWYEKYTADNWAIDGYQPYDPAVENILLLGNETLDYDVHVVTLSASYMY